jgi:hypothetical protein
MTKTRLPKKGCFRVTHPSTNWETVPCVAARPILPAPGWTGPETVGDGSDASAQVAGTLSYAFGGFASVTGVTSESDGTADNYSLQLNTNTFATSTCNGSATPGSCQGWQQFVFQNGSAGSFVFMQYWLINYGTPCPTGWFQHGSHCYKNSSATSVSFQPISNLAKLGLTAAAAAPNNGLDAVVLTDGSSTMSAFGEDTVLNLAQAWNFAEFNIFGNCCDEQANFNAGSTLVVQINLTNGTTSSPTCSMKGTTAETNNLNLVPGSCCATGGSSPAIQFTETNAMGVLAPFCLLNDITPILFASQ